MNRWYVAHTHAKGEAKALWHLNLQGFTAYLPRYRKRRRHARRIESVLRPLFPGYLFVNMDLGKARWRAIQSTIGVHELICNGEMPALLPAGVIEDIRASEDESGAVPVRTSDPFEKGEAVRITRGVWCEQVGLFERMTDDERIVILLNLLGRPLRVQLPMSSVGALA